ncbi:flavodoxin family protein [Saccharomonospora piscinae]|uniref:flavodoxin family protein n=1 Tax=Saccharomonospora piscinae TaxID=687388 RepID=UPI000463EC73|nr:flavodoxin family protein [Saccharomonospora piscinae]
MRALVVYESCFGNTRAVAEAVGDGLGEHARVELVEVGEAAGEIADGVDLLVVGAPTHAFGMSRPATRRDAEQRAQRAGAHLLSRERGVREWVAALRLPEGTDVAAFDTKIWRPRLPGSAAKALGRRLSAAGGHLAAPPLSFYVDDALGPLLDGELARARDWGARLAGRLAAH